ncbi:hypothetical protein NT6N_24610 [Oceaniferula spumae]|uniref:Uncharacterized protein n=1 Tax=Oceaniferula spumae TaxID=2979115 RepID=A0AAT9FN30_9BACT
MKNACINIGHILPVFLTPAFLIISSVAPLILWAIIFDSGTGEPYFRATFIGMFYMPVAVVMALGVSWIRRTDEELRGASVIFSGLMGVGITIALLVT